jgi:hypothetical protein
VIADAVAPDIEFGEPNSHECVTAQVSNRKPVVCLVRTAARRRRARGRMAQ